MKIIRENASILAEIQELDTIILEGNNLVKQYPNDHFLKISQAQALARKKNLQNELGANKKMRALRSIKQSNTH
ncbi:MAG: hypothetical protein ACKVOQ_09420 [Cyclobacteriaceae bacterium]